MKKKPCILIVDDDLRNREMMQALLESQGYVVETANDGLEALAKLKLGIDLVLLDIMMPGMDGFEVTRRIRQDQVHGLVPVMMVTSLYEKEDRLRAVKAGANDYISKPIDLVELKVRAASLLRMKEAQDTIREEREMLEEMVEKRTADLRRALSETVEAQRKTHQAHLDTIQRLALAAEYKDQGTAMHLHRMQRYCKLLSQGIRLPPGEIEMIFHAAPMHDVGKIGVPDGILLKPGKLTPQEWRRMKEHSTIGGRILGGSVSEVMKAGEIIALSHHERWDGSGYPRGLSVEAIPLSGRICAVADVFDALTSKRPYKKAFSNQEAVDIMRKERERHFDPTLLDVFLDHMAKVEGIQKSCGDTADVKHSEVREEGED
jgi:putative two-component system response regulator